MDCSRHDLVEARQAFDHGVTRIHSGINASRRVPAPSGRVRPPKAVTKSAQPNSVERHLAPATTRHIESLEPGPLEIKHTSSGRPRGTQCRPRFNRTDSLYRLPLRRHRLVGSLQPRVRSVSALECLAGGFMAGRLLAATFCLQWLALGSLLTGDLVASTPNTWNESEQTDVQLLYFTQAACGPCQQMVPLIDHLIEKSFPIQKVDAQQRPDLVQKFQVSSTPTFVLLRDGLELKRISGVQNSYQINALLLDAGYTPDQDILTKPTLLSPMVNFFDRLRPGQRTRNPEPAQASAQASPTMAIAPNDLTPLEQRALTATARIKVQYGTGGQITTDYGTGTVIHRQGQDILILTCGHLFRENQGRGQLLVELDFSRGSPAETVVGKLLVYDADAADVALVAASTRLPLQPMKLAPSFYRPSPNELLFSVGCDHGQPATVRRGQYLSTLRCGAAHGLGEQASDVMVPKFGVAGRPVVGRSGGGLFTARGELIGVCNAAVVGSDEGRYSAIDNVFNLLAQIDFARFFQDPNPNSTLQMAAAPITPARSSETPMNMEERLAFGSVSPNVDQSPKAKQKFRPIVEDGPVAISLAGDGPGLPTRPIRPNIALGQSQR